jgi:hypothetical protein
MYAIPRYLLSVLKAFYQIGFGPVVPDLLTVNISTAMQGAVCLSGTLEISEIFIKEICPVFPGYRFCSSCIAGAVVWICQWIRCRILP